MANPKEQTHRILSALKVVLKQNDFTYAQVAKGLGVSLPTVKRWLNASDVSLTTLAAICNLIDVELADLIAHSSEVKSEETVFTQEQEEFFANHPSYLAYLYELLRGHTPPEIEAVHKITPKSTRHYLFKLEQFGLIRIEPEGQVKTLVKSQIYWDDKGPLGLVFSKEMLRELSDRALNSLEEPSSLELRLWGRLLTATDYDEMKRDYLAIEEKFRDRSAFNKRFRARSELFIVSGATMMDEWDAEVYSHVREL